MFTQTKGAEAPTDAQGSVSEESFQDWDLDVSIVESGPSADRLIQMTDDGCGQTCESACSSSCP
ncbi:FxLD family lanthipeptide [Streptomyces sp. NRRL S-920]|uniref:FxLD family lanthipeptide n=1 Tax=Streptomyces sp. NRRL S-920 TaxID=1463921 RepID=UPI0004C56F5B|nr:FxLD family lanthipeptide [Streptomyces sp. NRRL S-920]